MRQDGRSNTPARRRPAEAGDTRAAPVGHGLLPVAVDGAVRGALAMLAGFALTSAIGLLLWTITPDVSGGPEQMLRGSTAGYVLAHFGVVRIGGSSLTIAPLLLTMIFGLLLVVGPARGRTTVATAEAEAVSVGSGAVSYGLLVTAATWTLAPDGARDGWAGLWATVLAAGALGLGMLWRGEALRGLVLTRTPRWLQVGSGAACGVVAVLVGGAALATAGALVASFSTAADLTDRLAGGVGGGIGLTLTGAGYLPNLVLAAVGYVVGVGFVVGPGTYSPFGSVPGDLPPFPPLAAVPDSSAASVIGLVLLVIPVGAAVVAGVLVMRGLDDRLDRLRGVLVAAAGAGVLIGLLVWLGSGGVTGGAWATIGAIGWQVGLVTAAAVLILAGSWVLAAGYGAQATDAVKGVGPRLAGRGGASPDDDDDGSDAADATGDPADETVDPADGTGDPAEDTDADHLDARDDVETVEPDGDGTVASDGADPNAGLDVDANPGVHADPDVDADPDLDADPGVHADPDGGPATDSERDATGAEVPAPEDDSNVPDREHERNTEASDAAAGTADDDPADAAPPTGETGAETPTRAADDAAASAANTNAAVTNAADAKTADTGTADTGTADTDTDTADNGPSR